MTSSTQPPALPGSDVASITVAFNPHGPRLRRQVAALRGQVARIVVIDNASTPPVEETLGPDAHGVEIVRLAENRGVAHGFNRGIEQGRRAGARHVLLLDDDSIPAADMVPALVAALERCRSRPDAAPVAAVGPRVRDDRHEIEFPFIRLGWLRNRRLHCAAAEDGVIACDFLISSGSLVCLAAIDALGGFDEALFIDSVDFEWCSRARARGFALYGACAASLDHELGESRRLVNGTVRMVVHSPERLYYMTRNRVLLYQRDYVPLKWKLKDAVRGTLKSVAMAVLIAPRARYARMALRAVRDGIARRGGKLTA